MVKNPPANAGAAGDTGSVHGSGKSLGGGNGNPLQYCCWDNPMDRGAWRASPWGHKESNMIDRLSMQTYAHMSTFITVYCPPKSYNSVTQLQPHQLPLCFLNITRHSVLAVPSAWNTLPRCCGLNCASQNSYTEALTL